ncbi:hypothetical protein Fcan01_08681 [Folsomia candida]|uniref:MADF domain-containing protein n=1 Tax=Folsomia candida TaxID=158441 RepID=A0A226ECD3_FOLCA|nr:hypothetical protein Fcan01_08681 [Folsomia candida]
MTSKKELALSLEVKLIDGVRDRPCLWNKCHPNYKLPKKVKKNWEGLRSQFQAFLKRLQKPTGSGGGRAFFKHEDAMSFIRGIIHPDECKFSNIDSWDDDEEKEVVINIDASQIIFLTDGLDSPAVVPRSKDIPQAIFQRPSTKVQERSENAAYTRTTSGTHTLHLSIRIKNCAVRKLDAFDTELLLGLLEKKEDEYDTFCKTLSQKLRTLGESDRKSFLEVQHSINGIVHDAEMKSLLAE